MNTSIRSPMRSLSRLSCILGSLLVSDLLAAETQNLLAHYTALAKVETPGLSGLSAQRGEALHRQRFSGGKPETPTCTSCHGEQPEGPGKTPAGKPIKAMAISVSPERYSDPAKVEKWFKRNCNEVLGRACTAQEKGDWLMFMQGR